MLKKIKKTNAQTAKLNEQVEMSGRFWLSDNEALLGIVFVLLIIGTLNVFSSSFIISLVDYDSVWFFLKKHGINLALGMIAFFTMLLIDYRKIRVMIVPVTIAVALMLIMVFIVGEEINGAKRWIRLGFMTMQPSEFAKVITIMITSAYIAHGEKANEYLTVFNPQMAIVLLFAILIEQEPDGATAAIVAGVPLLLLFCSNVPKKEKLYTLGAIILAVIGIFALQPYRYMRLKSLLDPWADPENTGYQVVQSLSAIGSGGLWGMGIGNGISKYQYLPEAHTDFAFSVWCQETGFLGAMVVFILFAGLAYYGTRIANKAPDIFGQFLAAGLTYLIVGQGVFNMLMVAGFFPVVGVPLPFISYGGTSLLITLAMIGILSNISRASKAANSGAQNISPIKSDIRPKLTLIKGGGHR